MSHGADNIPPNLSEEHKEVRKGNITPAEFFFIVFHNLVQILGPVSASHILYKIGKDMGKLCHRRVVRQHDLAEKELFLHVISIISSEHKCQLSLKSYDFPSGTVVVMSTNTLLGPSFGRIGVPVDFICSGCIAGVLESITSELVTCEEIRCVARGDEVCEFVAILVKPSEDVKIKIDTREVEEKLRGIAARSIFREALLEGREREG